MEFADVGQLFCAGSKITESLSGIMFKMECENASPVIARPFVDGIKRFGVGWLLRKIECLAAGTQVVFPTNEEADARTPFSD